MSRLIAKRIAGMVIVLFLLTVVTFLLMHVSPSDPVQMAMLREGLAPDPALVASIRKKYGLDQPLVWQYIYWLKGVLTGDFGFSLFYNEPVSVLLKEAIPRSINLTAASCVLAAVISFPLAILSFHFHDRPTDFIIRVVTFIALAIPTFWMAFLLLYVFAVRLGWLPVNAGGAAGIILPSVTLAIWLVGLYARRLRGAFLEEYRKNYMVGASVLGLSPARRFWVYLLPNSMPGVISMTGLTVGGLLGGSAVVETIFGWRGMGELMVDAILNQDYQLMQGYILWGGGVFILVNFLTDLLCMWLNPALLEKEKQHAAL